MPKIKKRFIVSFIFVIISIIFIWRNSIVPANISLNQSSTILYYVLPIVNKIGVDIKNLHLLIRKCAHITEFALCAVLLMVLFKYLINNLFIRTIIVLQTSMIVAIIDETIQFFSLGRTSSVIDIWIDVLGGLIGVTVFIIFNYIFNIFNKKIK